MKEIRTEGDVKELVKAWFKRMAGWSYAPVQNGLGVHGIHDRVGCVPIVVTQHMVGKKIGIFVSLECKAPGRRKEPRRGMSVHQELIWKEINKVAGFSEVIDGHDDLNALDGMLDYVQHGAR